MLSPSDAEKQADEQGCSVADVIRWERTEMTTRLKDLQSMPQMMWSLGMAAIIHDLEEHLDGTKSEGSQ